MNVVTLPPSRPVLRWHGGKWLLAPWIINHFPSHRVYVEPFGGAASVLLRKERAYAEVYNDLDGDVVNLFRVLRDAEQARALRHALRMTPFARAEFARAYERSDCPIEAARRLVVRSFMGFGSNGHAATPAGGPSTGFRASSHKSGTTPAQDWANYPDVLPLIADRLRGVFVESKPALEVLRYHDTPMTLHYVDPPYVHETRGKQSQHLVKHMYRHELTTADHIALLAGLRELSGMVVLSGYPHALYDDALADWHRVEREALADGARKRIEVLWINPAAWSALERQTLPLLAVAP